MSLAANWVHFGRALRRLGVDTSPDQVRLMIDALDHVDWRRRSRLKAAARAILVHRKEDLPVFDHLFDLFWHRDAVRPRTELELGLHLQRFTQKTKRRLAKAAPEAADGDLPQVEVDIPDVVALHSETEALRHKDFARLTDEERRRLAHWLRRLEIPWPPRPSRRRVAHPRGLYLDLRRTLRGALDHGGEAVELKKKRLKSRRRSLIVLCDISGSMEAYSRIFLQLIFGLGRGTGHLEAFVFGTRLTRITRRLQRRNVDQALAEATSDILDWGGGTRIGESFQTFNQQWGRRVMRPGAVVLVISDAWDRGQPDLMARQVERLSRRCSRLIWLNPLIGSEGYEPTAAGIRGVLPYIDDFLPIHNLHSLEQLVEHLARLSRPSPPFINTRSR